MTIEEIVNGTKDLTVEQVTRVMDGILTLHSLAIVPRMIVQVQQVKQKDSFETHVENAKENSN